MCSSAGHTTSLVRGSPIRKSSDQRSVDSSPRLIAASYVLHRLLVPRHPPCALNNLATQKTPPCAPGRKLRAGLHKLLLQSQKMLASTVQFSTSNQPPATRPHQTRTPHGEHDGMRCRPALTEATTTRGQPPGPVPSGPNSVPTATHPRDPFPRATRGDAVLGAGQEPAAELVSVPPSSTTPHAPRPLESEEPSRCGRGSGPPAPGWRPV